MKHTITIVSDGRTQRVELQPDESLLECLQRTGWHMPAPCGGIGRCGKCLVTIEPASAAGARRPEDERFTGAAPGRRLACRTFPVGDLTVRLSGTVTPPTSADTIAKGGSIDVPTSGHPIVILERVTLDPPSLEDQRSVYRRLRDATTIPGLIVDRDLLQRASSAVASSETDGPFLDLVIDAPESAAIDLTPATGDDDQRLSGLAFDIGTTTVAGYLLNLGTHEVTASRSQANAQAPYGADVISRITSFGNGAPLRDTICRQLAEMTRDLAATAGIDAESIHTAALVGNTTMIHLLLGLDPTSMSHAPFLPTMTESVALDPDELGLPVHPRARVRIVPGVSAYVGADIIADLLSCGMHRATGISLLVDIGTNGEIVCGGADGLIACSTAAGPAFEGATIRHGSGGVSGAINHVRREGNRLVIETIGGIPAASICGTGLMDAVAMLLEDGVLDETGRLDLEEASDEARDAYAGLLTEMDGEPALVLAHRAENGDGPLLLTQSDIRQVQLAKGAIAAGVQVLLSEAGITADELSAIYLAGGFGSYVRPGAALRVGLLPDVPEDRVHAIGNAAGAGAARMLVDRECADEAAQIVESCRYIELSGSALFQDHYMEQMMFPSREAV